MSHYHDPDYTFANSFVTLRTALGLTQTELAQRLGVTDRAIQRWEAGTRSPKAGYLKAFLALCIEQHVFPPGREIEQARTLWKVARLKVLFDEDWVRGLLSEQAPSTASQTSNGAWTPQSIARRIDWGEEGSAVSFYGRESEQAQLITWIQEEHCRLIALLGLGGIGKSALVVTLLHQLAPSFSVAVFRSVRDAIPCEELVADLIQALAAEPIGQMPPTLDKRIALLLNLLQTRRCLFVVDNVETLLQEGEQSGRYRVGYEGYARLFERIGGTQHQSCLLLTSREKPAELKPLEGTRTPVRSLHLAGLTEEAGEQILQEKQLRGDTLARQRLIQAYSGNPLALKIVTETIRDLFASDIGAFLAEGQIIFQGVRALLAQQFARLPFLEQSVLFWLAILREPVDVNSLLGYFVTPVPRLQLLEALEDLRRRSLVEHGQQRSLFTLQSVVMEYVTEALVKQMAGEIQHGESDIMLSYALSLATTKVYIRQTQERLIIAPVLFHLGAVQPRKGVVEQQLRRCLDRLRSLEVDQQGYGPTNITMLLLHLKGHLQGIDFSGCVLREAYLQGVQMQDASLQRAYIQASSFTEVLDIVTSVVVSPDGALWAVGSNSGDVSIFLGESDTPLLVFQAHTSVSIITFSPNGQMLATGGRDNLVKIWHREHGILLATLQGHTRFLQGAVFSPDGTQLATSGLDGTVRIWDMRTFQLLHLLYSHEQGVGNVAWSPDGNWLASGGDDGIRLWNPQSGKEVRTLADEGNGVYGVTFSPDSQRLASGGTDHLVKIWDVASGVCLESLRGHSARIPEVTWSPDGQWLASCSYDTTIRIWQANPAMAHQVLLGHTGYVQSLAFNLDSSRLFSGGEDQSVRLWELASGYCVRLLQGYTLSCYSVAWNPHGDIIAVATSDALVTLWNPVEERLVQVLRGHTQRVNAVTWSPDGQMLASSSADRTVRLWTVRTGECFLMVPYYADLPDISWSPDGRLIATGSREIVVWDVEQKRQHWVTKEYADEVKAFAWSPDGTMLASGGYDSAVRLWSAEDGTPLKAFEGHRELVRNIAWSPDGKLLAVCGGNELFIWNVSSGTALHISLAPMRTANALAWNPKGDVLLVGGTGGALYWMETTEWRPLFVRKEHQGDIRSISIDPDGHTVASGDSEGVVIIWDIELAVPLHTLRPDRPYERLDIAGIQGITEAQKMTLRALGAIGDE